MVMEINLLLNLKNTGIGQKYRMMTFQFVWIQLSLSPETMMWFMWFKYRVDGLHEVAHDQSTHSEKQSGANKDTWHHGKRKGHTAKVSLWLETLQKGSVVFRTLSPWVRLRKWVFSVHLTSQHVPHFTKSRLWSRGADIHRWSHWSAAERDSVRDSLRVQMKESSAQCVWGRWVAVSAGVLVWTQRGRRLWKPVWSWPPWRRRGAG